MSARKMYMTTQIVEAWRDNGQLIRVHWPTVKVGGVGLYVDVDSASFGEQFHPLDRSTFGMGLMLEGMKIGLRFRRPTWVAGVAVGIADGKLHSFVDGFPPVVLSGLSAADMLAEDWVVAE